MIDRFEDKLLKSSQSERLEINLFAHIPYDGDAKCDYDGDSDGDGDSEGDCDGDGDDDGNLIKIFEKMYICIYQKICHLMPLSRG